MVILAIGISNDRTFHRFPKELPEGSEILLLDQFLKHRSNHVKGVVHVLAGTGKERALELLVMRPCILKALGGEFLEIWMGLCEDWIWSG